MALENHCLICSFSRLLGGIPKYHSGSGSQVSTLYHLSRHSSTWHCSLPAKMDAEFGFMVDLHLV